MQLATERAGLVLRALQAGLRALAPHGDFVPLRAALAHLHALDPALSGEVLAPAELDPRSGLPGFAWLERARAEQVLARATPEGEEMPDEVVARAARVDPALSQRLGHRRALHRYLRTAALLEASHLEVRLKRVAKGTWDLALAYDRILPEAGWMRICADVSVPVRLAREVFVLEPSGTVSVDEGVRHLLSRQCVLPLLVLQGSLGDSLQVEVLRLSRSFVGPFWFPGLALPHDAPAWAQRGLTLHLSQEVVGQDVRESRHRDPWRGPQASEVCPPGFGLFRERRFAVSPHLVAEARQWSAERGSPSVVVGLRPT